MSLRVLLQTRSAPTTRSYPDSMPWSKISLRFLSIERRRHPHRMRCGGTEFRRISRRVVRSISGRLREECSSPPGNLMYLVSFLSQIITVSPSKRACLRNSSFKPASFNVAMPRCIVLYTSPRLIGVSDSPCPTLAFSICRTKTSKEL